MKLQPKTAKSFLPERKRLKMKSSLDILHLKDDSNDSARIQGTLKAGGVACAIVGAQDCGSVAAAPEGGDMTHIGTVAKALPAFSQETRSPNRNPKTWCEHWDSQPDVGSQKPDNCFQTHNAVGHPVWPWPTNAPCNRSEIEHGGLNT
jgi:hypothetical protein